MFLIDYLLLPVCNPLMLPCFVSFYTYPYPQIVEVLRLFCRQALKSMKALKSIAQFGEQPIALEVPYCVEVDGSVFALLAKALGGVADKVCVSVCG